MTWRGISGWTSSRSLGASARLRGRGWSRSTGMADTECADVVQGRATLVAPDAEPRRPVPHQRDADAANCVTVIGGGLAGCEAAWQLAERGVPVRLVEMRPATASPAHHTADFGELVCSNSLKSENPTRRRACSSPSSPRWAASFCAVAHETRVPAGGALAVDRERFARALTDRLSLPPERRRRARRGRRPTRRPRHHRDRPADEPGVRAALEGLVGGERLAFYRRRGPDRRRRVARPRQSCSLSRATTRGRRADYLNAPMTRDQYDAFYDALVGARRVTAKEFEQHGALPACQPVEEVARTGRDSLRFGALKPVGLTDPRTGAAPVGGRPAARREPPGSAYNLVGFQTNLAFGEQERVFRMIPGLERRRVPALRRDAPQHVRRRAARTRPDARPARSTVASASPVRSPAPRATARPPRPGLLAALNTCADITASPPVALPPTTALGALLAYATDPDTGPTSRCT